MKKIFIILLAAFVLAVINPVKSEAKVMYDGAEVVKGQTGKMTFKKDIKVYKRNPNGTFDSLVVKRNNFFRTYDIEKYDGKVFYQMGQYRVQATDLVIFKEVPIEIRSSFYTDPSYIVINRDRMYHWGHYGQNFSANGLGVSLLNTNNGQQLKYCADYLGEPSFCDTYTGTDIKIAETKRSEKGVRFELTKDTFGKVHPLKESPYLKVIMKKRSIFYSEGLEINGFLYVTWKANDEYETPFAMWIPVNLLKPVADN